MMMRIRRTSTLVSLHLFLLQQRYCCYINNQHPSSVSAFVAVDTGSRKQNTNKNARQHQSCTTSSMQRYTMSGTGIVKQSRISSASTSTSTSTSTSRASSSSSGDSRTDIDNGSSTQQQQQQQQQRPVFDKEHVETVLFVECGFGSDAHGQNSTKAAVRACRNAIEFNQIPCIGTIIPGGRNNMKLDVRLGVPIQYQKDLDLTAIRQCFPYGKVHIQCPSEGGGLIASSGKVIAEMGDTNDDMIIVCVAVTVGY